MSAIRDSLISCWKVQQAHLSLYGAAVSNHGNNIDIRITSAVSAEHRKFAKLVLSTNIAGMKVGAGSSLVSYL